MPFNQAVIYHDDGLCIRYQDGSVLQLSPCGSVFRFHENSTQFQRPYFQQLTRFAVSSLKKKVSDAVTLRNQFASRPYLCKELLEKDRILVIYNKVTECTWPKTLLPEFVVKNSNGSVSIKSLDGYATLTLNSHRQTFSVCYVAEVAPDLTATQETQENHNQHIYTWLQTADQSVQDCPQCWDYPLKTALAKTQDKEAIDELPAMDNVSKFPQSLPVTCNAAHLHKWKLKEVFTGNEEEEVFWQPNMKVVWKNDVTYRISQNKKDMLKVEISPGDDSIFISSGLTGKYFKHFTDADTQEKMYTADKPPPDRVGMKYSTAKLLRQGSRLFEFVLHVGIHASVHSTICWKSKAPKEQEYIRLLSNPPHVTETADVPNVGRFVTYSNGHLHIAFHDRTLLNVRFNQDLRREDLQFNITLPNGQVLQGSSQHMKGLERYIHLACEWGEWVNSSPQQRNDFYKDTIWDQNQQRIIEAEMDKLRRFNYILNHGTLNHKVTQTKNTPSTSQAVIEEETHSQSGQEDFKDLPDVSTALQNTMDRIKDIENFLSSK